MGDSAQSRKVHTFVETQLDRLANEIERRLDADVMSLVGPIVPGLEDVVRSAIEARKAWRKRLVLILTTPGGVIEVVERIVNAIRHQYGELVVIVPDAAMSAGTVLALSADRIMMDYFSCLGPIDPQIERGGKLVPALSYLIQFERLRQKSVNGELTTSEMMLLQQLDLAELHKFEEARELSVSLLKEWLARYKFKDWTRTETNHHEVTAEMRTERAGEIATALMDPERWHSHGRPIHMDVLQNDLKLKIEDMGDDKGLRDAVRSYHLFLTDYMSQINVPVVVHTEDICLK